MSAHGSSSEGRAKLIDDVLSGAETTIRFIAEGVSGSGVPGLESAAKTILGIISQIKKCRDNGSACSTVADQIAALADTLKATVDSIKAQTMETFADEDLIRERLGTSAELLERISNLQRRLGEISDMAQKLEKQSGLKKLLSANRNADILKDMNERLRQSRDEFAMRGQLAIEVALQGVVKEMKANAERLRAQERQRTDAELDAVLRRLPQADADFRASIHARHGGLLAGTRVQILHDLADWIDASSDLSFYILSGAAGTGKSTIAFEVAKRAEQSGQLGASFFFMRGSEALSTTAHVLPTIIHQLIAHVPSLRTAALPVLCAHLAYGERQNMDHQVRDLFVGLLSTLPADHPPIVIVIDALDECTEEAQELVPRMLFLMMDALTGIACPVRVLVTSRPEMYIEDAFQSAKLLHKSQRFRLHEVPRPVIDSDIRFYFDTALALFPETSRSVLFLLYPDAVEDLTALAAGLFIYATTAVEYLKLFSRSDISRGLELLMATGLSASPTSFKRLNNLYTVVLSSAFPDDFLALPGKLEHVRAVLGCIAVLQDHVAPRALATLWDMRLHDDVLPVLDRMGAVISFAADDPDAPIRPLHASFGEFLVDASRCTDPKFFVDSDSRHSAFASQCLALLARPAVLRRNICDLQDSLCPKDAVPGLARLLAQRMPPAVQYACVHWPAHAALSRVIREDLRPVILSFCSSRLLVWIEALSLLDHLDVAVHWLPAVRSLINSAFLEQPADLTRLLNDAVRLSLEFSPAISTCPGQLYVSALRLCPYSCLLRYMYASTLDDPTSPKLLGEEILNWTPWMQVEPSDARGARISGLTSVRYAPHARWVACGVTPAGNIHICSANTGVALQSFSVNSGRATGFDMSDNGLRVVAVDFQSTRVSIFSTRSGAALHTTTPAVMPASCIFVSGGREVLLSGEGGVYVWSPDTDKISELPCSEADWDEYRFACASTDGRWALVIDSDDMGDEYKCHVFDVLLRAEVAHFPNTSRVACFVPGSSTVVLGRAGSVCICDILSGAVICDLCVPDKDICAIAASQDGRTIVCHEAPESEPVFGVHYAAHPHAVHLWDTARRRSATLLPGAAIACLDISPDGSRLLLVIAGSGEWRMIDILTDAEFGSMGSQQVAAGELGSRDIISISADSTVIATAPRSGESITLLGAPSLSILQRVTVPDKYRYVPRFASQTTTATYLVDLALSSNAEILAAAFEDRIHLCKRSPAARWIGSFDLPDPGNMALLTDADNSMVLGTPDHEMSPDPKFSATAISADDKLLFAAIHRSPSYPLACVAIWDLSRMELSRVLLIDLLAKLPYNYTIAELRITSSMDLRISVRKYPRLTFSVPRDAWSNIQDPIVLVEAAPVLDDTSYDLSPDGWLVQPSRSSPRPIMWVPPSRRPRRDGVIDSFATRNNTIVMGSTTGLLTAIQVPSTLREEGGL